MAEMHPRQLDALANLQKADAVWREIQELEAAIAEKKRHLADVALDGVANAIRFDAKLVARRSMGVVTNVSVIADELFERVDLDDWLDLRQIGCLLGEADPEIVSVLSDAVSDLAWLAVHAGAFDHTSTRLVSSVRLHQDIEHALWEANRRNSIDVIPALVDEEPLVTVSSDEETLAVSADSETVADLRSAA